MSDAAKAIFLSYARDDAAVARRIAEALRASGLEVWFDENELRGGDAWDAKIRRQIDDCALFVPLVSVHTQERSKGYFRLEWKLAVDQTHMLAEGVPFIAPVVIDDTRETGALVPAEFMKVQWMRLPSALPTPQFVAQVQRLMSGGKIAAGKEVDIARPPSAEPDESVGSPPKSTGTPLWKWGAVIAALGAVAIGVVMMRKSDPTGEPSSMPAAKTAASVAPAAVVDAKSIAVLPFTNMSEEKDSGFFADGVHEDILTNLAHIASLRVVSRTSVMEYRGTTKKIRQIGQELGVAWLLEGSVQRSGNKVRVTGQLINALTDQHVWAQSYDRDLTDTFAIQAALAQEIANALSAALSPAEKARLEHPPTTNPAAYDLQLRARQIDRDGNDTRQELETQEAMLQSAVSLDPEFASAWSELATVHSQIIFNSYDTSDARMVKAREAIETAQRLDPEKPEVILGTGVYYYYALRDYSRALEQIGRLITLWPKNYFGPFMAGLILRRQGKWAESTASLRHAEELDPRSADIARNLMLSLVWRRHFPEAIAEQERRVQLVPESLRESFEVTRLKYYATGSTAEGDAVLAGPIADRAKPETAAGYRKFWAAMKGDLATVARLDREQPDAWAPPLGSGGGSPAENAWNNAIVMAAQGDLAGARARVEKFPAELQARLVNESRNPGVLSVLAMIESLLGHKETALAAAHRAREIMPDSLDLLSARSSHFALAIACAWSGEKDAAVAELRLMFATSGVVNVYFVKNGPWFAPLKGDPAFDALVNDPKNNAPLP